MYELIAEYGTTGLTWILAAMGIAIARYVLPIVANVYAKGLIARAWDEVRGAVLEVGQTYVDALKEKAADGKLDPDQQAEAKLMAITVAKSNIGVKGLKRLARILGVDVGGWLESKVETAVALSKPAASKTVLDVADPQ